jgi:periplasmic copper chaperone A
MKKTVSRRDVLQASLALGAALLAPSLRACEFFTSTLRVTHPWTRATGEDLSSAVLCMKFDEVTESDRLIGVETPVAAAAELVGEGSAGAVDLLIPAGRETLLSEEGSHIRLLGLAHPLLLGRAYPLTLVFEKGGVLHSTLNVDYQGSVAPFAKRRRF